MWTFTPLRDQALSTPRDRGTERTSLSSYSDDEIAAEYHRRALAKLGDQRVGVGLRQTWPPVVYAGNGKVI